MSCLRKKKKDSGSISGAHLFRSVVLILTGVDVVVLLSLYCLFTAFSGQNRSSVLLRVMIWTAVIIAAGSAVVLLAAYRVVRKTFLRLQVHGREMQQQIDEDILTEASSRRKGIRLLEAELARQRMLGRFDSVVMMVDMDHFKMVNDTYGHTAGDESLKEVVAAIRSVSRKADDIIRWGGDEFIGIYRGMTENDLENLRMRLRKVLSGVHVVSGEERITVAASVGLSFFRESDESYFDVIKRADHALYIEKERKKETGQRQGCIGDDKILNVQRT